MMDFQIPDFGPALAELFLAAAALLILLLISFLKRTASSAAFWLSQIALLMTAVLSLMPVLTGAGIGFTFGQMFINDPMGAVLKSLACVAVLLVLLYGRRYLSDRRIETPEYYLLVLFATLGIMVLITAGNLLTVYLGLELLSLSSYALVAINRDSARSTEAAMKYFVLGALSSGLLLYGISMIYGATQTLDIVGVYGALFEQQANRTVLMFGVVFLVAGIAFKLGVVPFHMWIPDVYDGAPSAVTLFISTAPKLAAFVMTFRLLAIGLWDLAEQWQKMLMFTAVASIVLGNLAAIAQTSFKRMLAYSAISHMGFMLLGLVSGVMTGGDRGGIYNAYGASLFYVVTYALTGLASFGVLLLLSRKGFEAENIDDFKGLNQRSAWWAAMTAIVMFSMAGIPFFVGFFSKFFVLQTVITTGRLWLAVLAVLMSLIGAFYYLRIVKLMYFDEPTDHGSLQGGFGMRLVLSLNVLAIALLGLFPGRLMQLCVNIINASI